MPEEFEAKHREDLKRAGFSFISDFPKLERPKTDKYQFKITTEDLRLAVAALDEHVPPAAIWGLVERAAAFDVGAEPMENAPEVLEAYLDALGKAMQTTTD